MKKLIPVRKLTIMTSNNTFKSKKTVVLSNGVIHTKYRPLLLKLASFLILEIGWVKLAFAQIQNPLKFNDFGDIVKALAGAVAKIGLPIAVLFLIYSGFLFVTAQGNEQKISKAKTTFFWTIVGTVLIIGAWAIALALNEFTKSLQ